MGTCIDSCRVELPGVGFGGRLRLGLRVGLKVNHHASPPKARGAAGTMVICGGGQFCPQEGKMGVGRRGVACGSQPSYPSGMPKGMPVQ